MGDLHLWLEIVARELAMLVTLFALGVGPASFLGRRFDTAARLAIAPVFGLCLATCVFTTLIWFTAASNTYWLLPVIVAVSIATAVRRSLTATSGTGDTANRLRTAFARLRARDAISLLLVCVIVAAPLSYTLHERDSVGPTGFLILDADGYTLAEDGMQQLSIREALRPAAEDVSFVHKFWKSFAGQAVNLDASPLSANLDLLIGLHATDTQSLFMIMFLVAGALGAFATVRYLSPKPGWTAPLAGVLFAGPLFLQLLADGSQAATCGLAVLMPLAILGFEILREQKLANLMLFALLASGLMSLYPVHLPGFALAAALVLIAIAVGRRLRGRFGWRAARRAGALIAGVTALTIVFNLVAFPRAVRYWLETLGTEALTHKPEYDLPLSVLPGWVLQTRQFYVLQSPPLSYLQNLTQAQVVEVLGEAVLPAILIAVILFGLWRDRRGLMLLSIVVVFAALAEYASAADNCSYCVDRNTLASAPTSIVLLAVGIGALALGTHRWMRWAAVAVAVAAVIMVGAQTWTERQLFAAEAYYLGGDERKLVSALPADPGPVDMEGFGENAELEGSVAELPLVYALLYERNHGEVSLPSEYANYGGFAYLNGPYPRDPDFRPSYRYVLTRLGGVETGRRVLARAGPLALEERTAPLDATVTSGLALPMVREDATGQPSVVQALHLLAVGGGSAPAWVRLRFRTLAPAAAGAQPGLLSKASAHELTVCVEATGLAPVRTASVRLAGTLYEGLTPHEKFALREPPRGITLVGMSVAGHCSP